MLLARQLNLEACPAAQVKTAVIKLQLLLLYAICNVYTLLPNSRDKPFAQDGILTTAAIITSGQMEVRIFSFSAKQSLPGQSEI